MDCHVPAKRKKGSIKESGIAIIGNPNVGKSCLFNFLTNLGATVSNYPGTTVDIMEGDLKLKTPTPKKDHGYFVADLPGLYSFDDSSPDVKVTKKYIIEKRPSLVINVISALQLERSLNLTFELKKTNIPMIVALNFIKDSTKRNQTIDLNHLSASLGLPVIAFDAASGENIEILAQNAIEIILKKRAKKIVPPKPSVRNLWAAQNISKQVTYGDLSRDKINDKLNRLTTSPFSGFLILLGVLVILFASLFFVGNWLSSVVNLIFTSFIGDPLKNLFNQIPIDWLRTILNFGLVDGINAALQIAIPYIAVFYVLLAILEDSGYLTRMVYLLDKTMHKIGLHGKSIIPMMLGFGCTVPAILSTRIIENRRDRVITAILVNLIPCSARTAVILGAAGKFIGGQYALAIYLIVLTIIFLVGYILSRYLPGTPEGFVMEIPEYRLPKLKNILIKTWIRMKEFIWMAAPMIIIGSMVLGLMMSFNLLEPLTLPFKPIISGWLMLPMVTAVTLIYGILRKELALEMLILIAGSSNLLAFMTPLQIFIFCLLITIYFPCIATFTVLNREFGIKTSFFIALSTIILAVTLSGLIGRMLLFFNIFN